MQDITKRILFIYEFCLSTRSLVYIYIMITVEYLYDYLLLVKLWWKKFSS